MPGFVYSKEYYRIVRTLPRLIGTILAKEDMEGATTRLLEGGYSDVVLLAERGDRRRVIKIPIEEGSATNEVYWYSVVNACGLAAPRLVAYDISKRSVPYVYEVLEHVNGRVPSSRGELYDAGLFAGKQLRALHRIRTTGFGSMTMRGWNCRTWLDVLKNQIVPEVEEHALSVLSTSEMEMVHELTIYNKGIDIKKPRMLHGDLHQDNMLFMKGDNGFVMFDPGYAISGDPMFDLAYATIRRSAGFDEGISDGYGVESLTDAESHRFALLRLFCLLKELSEYIKNKDSAFKIRRLSNSLRHEASAFA